VEVEVTARCLLFLLEIHHGPILANQVSIPYLVISKSHILMYKPFLFRCKGELSGFIITFLMF
jgi:hypothetical protein